MGESDGTLHLKVTPLCLSHMDSDWKYHYYLLDLEYHTLNEFPQSISLYDIMVGKKKREVSAMMLGCT